VLLLYVLAVLASAGVLYQRLGARRMPRPPGQLVDVGGHRLHALCAGEGDPVVLLESAIAGSSLSWSVVQPEIAKLTRVCAYDRAGLAWSDPPSCPRTLANILDELSVLIARTAASQRLVLVGHSFGSFVVRAYAAQHPRRVAGLVLIDPPTEWLPLTPPRARLLWGGRHMSRLGALLAHAGVVRLCLALLTGGAPGAPRRFVKVFGPTTARTLERMVGEVRKLPPEVHPMLQALWCQPKCFSAMGDYLKTFEREAAAMMAAELPSDIPVTVISRHDQPAAQMAAHRALAERSSAGRHVVAARSRHWIQFDQPELIVQAVRQLLPA
jgi:pimeloyl-ACP methyl ester carboxylesterase